MKSDKKVNHLLSTWCKLPVETVSLQYSPISLEMSVCALSMGMQEERYLEIVRRYEKPDAYAMSEAFGALVQEMDNCGEGLKDIFGEFFMEYITHGHNGQFFTPEPICEMMARMQGDIADGSKNTGLCLRERPTVNGSCKKSTVMHCSLVPMLTGTAV